MVAKFTLSSRLCFGSFSLKNRINYIFVNNLQAHKTLERQRLISVSSMSVITQGVWTTNYQLYDKSRLWVNVCLLPY